MTPKITKFELLKQISALIDFKAEKCCVVGIRGYYLNTLGRKGINDRGVYDDAIFVLGPDVYLCFQANTDPSKIRPGIATLVPGVYSAEKHKHKGRYAALQLVHDTVKRDGQRELDSGRHGINIHFGALSSTGSEGCQTLQRKDWFMFQSTVYKLMDRFEKRTIKYVLIENK